MASRGQKSRFERRPGLTLAVILLAAFAVAAAGLELLARATLDYHIDYYAGTSRPGRVEYPYGHVLINRFGQPDLDWDLSDARPRVGFYGDSVTYGVGAGHGHRISDLVRAAHPEVQVMTFAAVGARLKDPARVAALAERFGLGTLIYVMNLNDLTPDPPRRRSQDPAAAPGAQADGAGSPTPRVASETVETGNASDPWVRRGRAFVVDHLDGLRNKSYAYNFLRLRVKNLIVRMGYESSGFRAVELQPSRHPLVFDATAARVNDAARRLRAAGVRPCVLLLPYEMQISAQAEARYRELGVPFDADFVQGFTQQEILRRLDLGLEVLDARTAFLDPVRPEASRRDNGLGIYFVYDRGDKIDWNHPTRAGHQKIAEHLLAEEFCGL